MRVLFTLQPGLGHFHPLIPLARLLAQRGHDVAFACAKTFVPEVDHAGFRAHPAGIDWLTMALEDAFPAVRDLPPGPTRYAWVRQHLFADATARMMVPDLLALARTWPPDLIVRDAAEYGGYLAAETLGIPHAMVRTDSGSAAFGERAHVAAPLATIRASLGVPPDACYVGPFRYLCLTFAGPLDDPTVMDAPTTHQLRPLVTSDGQSHAWTLWPGAIAGQPLVYATLGTVYNHLTGIFDAILDGLRGAGVNLLMTVGPTQDPAQFGPQPAHVRIERYVPQAAMLPHSDLVLTHGGYGTVSAALAHGLPLVLLPISADQPQNAARCLALGVGRLVGPTERTPLAIREAVQDVLADPGYRARAVAVSEAVGQLPDSTAGVMLLERLARERQPLLARPGAEYGW